MKHKLKDITSATKDVQGNIDVMLIHFQPFKSTLGQ